MKNNVAVIGAGNMGRALMSGMLVHKVLKPDQLRVTGKSVEKLRDLHLQGISTYTDNISAIDDVEVIILAVKPQILSIVLSEIRPHITQNHLLISIAAGYTIQSIEKIAGNNKAIVRVMPNLAAAVGESVSCWIPNSHVKPQQLQNTIKILQSIGSEYQLSDESLLDAVTAISGSGPAYFYYLADQLIKNALAAGIEPELAQKLVKQTFIGSAAVLKTQPIQPAELMKRVTSKGGTTEAALQVFTFHKLDTIIQQAVQAALKRARELHL